MPGPSFRSHLPSRSRSRALQVVAAIAGGLASLAAVTSCILADPPPDLPKPPKHHPIVVKESVVPPYTQVLGALPPKFVVPIELIDPDTSFVFEIFVDYDGTDPRQPPVYAQSIAPTPATLDGGISIQEFSLSAMDEPDPSSCHRVELLVALGFNVLFPHTPDAYGADSVVWFYNPSGDPGRCPLYDAGGADGAAPDQQTDGVFIPPPPDGGE